MNPNLIEGLRKLFGERFTTSSDALDKHSQDISSLQPLPPEGVCYPLSTAEVAAAVDLCRAYHTPIIPFGAGTSLEGHVFAPHGGVSFDVSGMRAVLRVSQPDLDCTVQAGVTRQQLNAVLEPDGLFFPVDPGAESTFGGMASTRASGTNAVRYGTMRDNILGLTVVLADGHVIKTGSRARKSSAGYDLTHLFVGAEGTLGVITEITLRLHGLPEAISAAVVGFDEFDGAVQAVADVMRRAVPVARIEFLDEVMIEAVNSYSSLSLPTQPTLFLEFHGSATAVREDAATVGRIMRERGGSNFRWAESAGERAALWKARHNAYYAAIASRPGCKALTTDVCVPISRLAECIVATKRDLHASSIQGPIVGHVGDGNFHVLLLVDPQRPEERVEAERLNQRLVQRALALEGTITGEHGVGIGKQKYMQAEHGAPALEAMRAIKCALDPHNLMNPGKLVPANGSTP